MAYEIELINVEVTKREYLGLFYYDFPKAFITVNPIPAAVNDHIITIRILSNSVQNQTNTYGEITDKLTSTTAEEYVDELATLGIYF